MRPTVVGGMLSVVLIASLAHADAVKAPEELFEVRVRYGVAKRFGSYTNPSGATLSYDGWTPNDPSLHAWVWPLFDGLLGFTGGIGREGFGLFDRDTNERVTSGGLLRAQAAVTARFRLGWARFEPVVGYALGQVAEFRDAAAPTFSAGSRHGVLLAARGLIDLGPVTIEGRFEYPLGLAAVDGSGARSSSTGLSVGGGVRVALLRTGTALWGLMAEGAFSQDSLSGPSASALSEQSISLQNHLRLGLALRRGADDDAGHAAHRGDA